MSRAAAYCDVMAAYSELAALAGTGCPVTFQRLLDTRLFSPKSVRAMMLRVLDVLPDLFVTHTSTRLIVTPDVRLGSERIDSS